MQIYYINIVNSEIGEEEAIISFNINIFSHDKNMTLNEKYQIVQYKELKEIYKAKLGINTKLEVVQLYSQSKLSLKVCNLRFGIFSFDIFINVCVQNTLEKLSIAD